MEGYGPVSDIILAHHERVEIFTRILAGKDVRFRHGEDADFDAELGLDKRIEDYSLPVGEVQVDGTPSEESAEQAERDAAAAGDK
jgi:hypothetical protein